MQLEEVALAAMLLLGNSDLHRSFVEDWMQITSQDGPCDALLFLLCHPGTYDGQRGHVRIGFTEG